MEARVDASEREARGAASGEAPGGAAGDAGGGGSARMRAAISLVLAVSLLALGGAAFQVLLMLRAEPGRVAVERPRTAVRVEPAERGAYRERVSGYGRARALRRATVAAEVMGNVVWVADGLEVGAAVREGELLVRIDDRDLRQAAATARARLAQAEAAAARLEVELESLEEQRGLARADLDTARSELARVRDLFDRGLASPSELDRQRLQVGGLERQLAEVAGRLRAADPERRRAASEVDAAEAARERAALDLARAEVRAPFRGRVTERHAQVGARVAPGAPLFGLVDAHRVEVAVALPASRFDEVSAGAAVRVRLREGGPVVWRGAVERVGAEIDPASRTFAAYLRVAGVGEGDDGYAPAPVPPGAFVVAEVEGRLHEDVIPIPRAAFVGDRVYVALSDGGDAGGDGAVAVERRPVVRRALADVALVEAGIEPGEAVIVTNLEQIVDGTPVRIDGGASGQDRRP